MSLIIFYHLNIFCSFLFQIILITFLSLESFDLTQSLIIQIVHHPIAFVLSVLYANNATPQDVPSLSMAFQEQL